MAVGDGLVRLRVNQIGKQTVFATAVAATRRVGWRGLVSYDPGRTQPDVDEGSIDPVQSPVVTAPIIGLASTGPMVYNDIQSRLSAALKGGVTSSGAGATKTSVFTLLSLTADPFDYYTIESGDDQSATDGIQAYGGVIDTLVETMPESLGALTFADTWVFAAANLATNRTAALTLDNSPVYVNGDDTAVYIDTVAGSIGTTQVTDALRSYTLTVNNNLDKKRFANGSNSRRKYAGYGRGARVIELALTFDKNAAVMAEENTIDDDPTPNRYIQLVTNAATSPYAYTRGGAFRLFTVADGESGGNALKILTYRAYYDATLTYAFKATVVNTLAI